MKVGTNKDWYNLHQSFYYPLYNIFYGSVLYFLQQ